MPTTLNRWPELAAEKVHCPAERIEACGKLGLFGLLGSSPRNQRFSKPAVHPCRDTARSPSLKGSTMIRELRNLFLLVAIVAVGLTAVRADTVINIATSSGNGISFTKAVGGDYVTFSNMTINDTNDFPGDSANGAPMTISPGAGGHFLLSSKSSDGLTGYFTANNSATVSMGNASSGILTASISMVEIDTTTSPSKPGGTGSFSLVFTLSNLKFSNCTATSCTNSQMLQEFATVGGNAQNAITFSFNTSTAANVAQLMGLAGSHGTTSAGTMDSPQNVTPEPGTLALLATGILFLVKKLFERKDWAG
jgi:hypothetical protein